MKRIIEFFRNQPPGRLITLGFFLVIMVGALLLLTPLARRPGVDVRFVDALFTSTSAVCVTGLIAIDTYDTFSVFGRAVVALLIQVGGLGVTSVGAGLILAAGKKFSFKSRLMIKEGLNVDSFKGVVRLVKSVLLMTFCFELVGALLSFIVFVQDYPPLHALGNSVFHSIAAFNNSGFDVLGGLQNLIPYRNDVLLNLTTCGLIIFGGIGFLVILDVLKNRFHFRKLALHSKVVITTSIFLIVVGTVILKLTDDVTWLGAFFHSVSARTAGFSTYPLGTFSNAGLFALTLLMFIGASPGSTGGGIKTSTFFTLVQSMRSALTKRHFGAFRRSLPRETLSKAYLITLLSLCVVCTGTLLVSALEPHLSLMQVLFEVTSAFGTVGLSTGITPDLCDASKYIITAIMFIGRLGALTIITMWINRPEQQARYTEESITIG